MNKERIKQEELLELLDDTGLQSKLILYNDDINSFDHVIECLVRICDHNEIQAEQSALLVHFKGKATVKSGDRGEMAAMCQALCDEGLSAVLGE